MKPINYYNLTKLTFDYYIEYCYKNSINLKHSSYKIEKISNLEFKINDKFIIEYQDEYNHRKIIKFSLEDGTIEYTWFLSYIPIFIENHNGGEEKYAEFLNKKYSKS